MDPAAGPLLLQERAQSSPQLLPALGLGPQGRGEDRSEHAGLGQSGYILEELQWRGTHLQPAGGALQLMIVKDPHRVHGRS